MYRTLKYSIFIIFWLPLAYSLEADKLEKVRVWADSAVYNYKAGVNLYEGHVKVDQGTTHITADRLITKSNNQHQIREAIAYGLENLAHYWTLPNKKEPEIRAEAKIIKFYPLEFNIVLEQHVTIIQGQNHFQGQIIFYNKRNQTITLPPSKNGQALIVYSPGK